MCFTKKIIKLSMFFILIFSFSYGKETSVVLTSNFQSILGGENWSPTNNLTQMKSNDGNIFEFTTNLPKGNYEYKVALNGSWKENYGLKGQMGGDNILFSLSDNSNITFTFDSFSKRLWHKVNYSISSSSNSNALTNVSDFIDVSDTELMFLFQTHNNAKISFYLSEFGKPLNTIINNLPFSGKELVVGDLVPGKKYQYKIKSTLNNKTIESSLVTFTKVSQKTIKSTPQWAKTSIFYELFLRSFYDKSGDGIGDFQGLKEKIPYLKDLGVNALWLTPINSSTTTHGYDITDFKNINKDFGSLDDFKSFMAEAKKNNIKVVMEMVFNSTSIEHPWFKKALEDKKSPYRDYYFWEKPFAIETEQNSWHGTGDKKYLASYSELMPDLNIRNPKVREELKNVVKFWMDLGVDGFRFPNYNYIDNNSSVNELWWKELSSFAKSINKDVLLIGQNADLEISLSKKVLNNMDSVSDYLLYSIIYSSVLGGKIEIGRIPEFLDSIYKNNNPDYISLASIGDHDYSRQASILKKDLTRQKFIMSILLTLPSVPFIYYGDELGQTGEKGHEYIREAMDWYKGGKGVGMTSASSDLYTIPNDGISVEEQKEDQKSLLNYTKKLTQIRKDYPILTNGKSKKSTFTENVNIIEVGDKEENLTIIYNFSDSVFSFTAKDTTVHVNPLSTAIIKDNKNLLED